MKDEERVCDRRSSSIIPHPSSLIIRDYFTIDGWRVQGGGSHVQTCQVFYRLEQKDSCAPGWLSAMMELSLIFAAFFDNGAV